MIIDGTWKDIKNLGENGLDPNNEDHRSAKYLHDNLSQADKDRVAVDEQMTEMIFLETWDLSQFGKHHAFLKQNLTSLNRL